MNHRSIKSIFLALTVVFVSGCATAQLAKGPDTNFLKSHAGSSQVAVAMVEDIRTTTRAGSIGATSVNVPANVSLMVYNYLVICLNENFRVNIKEPGKTSQENNGQPASSPGSDRVIVSKISSIKISSFDAIMQPVQTEVKLDLSVLDQKGQLVYKQSYFGKYEERIGISIVDSKTGQLVEAAVKNLMMEISNDNGLKNALAK